ncbi:MAG: cobalt ECF transporter T component CbiQ [Brevinematia bacterium]
MIEFIEEIPIKGKESNIILKIDTRLKLLVLFSILLLNVIFSNVIFSLFLLLNSIILTLFCRVEISKVLKSIKLPIVFALIVLVTQALWLKQGKELEIIGIKIYEQGIMRGTRIFLTVLSSVWLLVLTSIVSKPNDFLSAFKKIGIPQIVVDVAIMMYRYSLLLREEAMRIFYAQKLRFGYNNIKNSIKSVSELWGIMLVNSIVRAQKVYEAMVSRGYNGKLFYESDTPIDKKELVISISYILMIALIGIILKLVKV